MRSRRSSWWIPALLFLGCSGKAPEPASEAAPRVAEPAAPAKPRFVPAAEGVDVADEVRTVVGASGDEKVVVYVGASWCEPCQAFHAALERGDLDVSLAGVKFLEYDADRDRECLESAGHGGRLIPRFALPGPDGKFAGQKIEGGIKCDGAVDHILDRLLPLLPLPPADQRSSRELWASGGRDGLAAKPSGQLHAGGHRQPERGQHSQGEERPR